MCLVDFEPIMVKPSNVGGQREFCLSRTQWPYTESWMIIAIVGFISGKQTWRWKIPWFISRSPDQNAVRPFPGGFPDFDSSGICSPTSSSRESPGASPCFVVSTHGMVPKYMCKDQIPISSTPIYWFQIPLVDQIPYWSHGFWGLKIQVLRDSWGWVNGDLHLFLLATFFFVMRCSTKTKKNIPQWPRSG